VHVMWIFMENHSYGEIVGSRQAPFIDRLAHECGLAANYHNVSHPSLPNYIAATSGLALARLAQFGSDCGPSRECSTGAPNIFGEVRSWRAYEESMPNRCSRGDAGEYAVRHNPPPYFTTLARCRANDVPFARLASDLASGALPAFSFVTPNLVHDMHDASVTQGDEWLNAQLPAIVRSRVYKRGDLAVFVTWDEGEGGSSSECATNTADVGCHVATLVISPSTAPDTISRALFNHYSLLASAERLLGVPLLGEARRANNMLAAFDL
jgi:phospholipase C